MKSKMSRILSFKPILISLIMAGLYFVSPTQMQAQSSTQSNFYVAPVGPYVDPATAISRLEEQLVSLKGQLEFYNSSSQEWKLVNAKFNFFNVINQSLVEGRPVQVAIEDGLKAFGSSEMSSGLPKGKKEEYRLEVINLLKL